MSSVYNEFPKLLFGTFHARHSIKNPHTPQSLILHSDISQERDFKIRTTDLYRLPVFKFLSTPLL